MFGGLKNKSRKSLAAPAAAAGLEDVFSSQESVAALPLAEIIAPPPTSPPPPTPTPPARPSIAAATYFSSPPYFADAQQDDTFTQQSATQQSEEDYYVPKKHRQLQLDDVVEEEDAGYVPNRGMLPTFSSSDDDDDDEHAKKKKKKEQMDKEQRKSTRPSLRLKSSRMSNRELLQIGKTRRKARVKIEPMENSGQFKVHLFYWRTKRNPVLNSMEEARDVLDWYTKTRFIGVRPLLDDGFASYFVFNGEICHVNGFQFTTAELAAEKHDQLARENNCPYRKNFRLPSRRRLANRHGAEDDAGLLSSLLLLDPLQQQQQQDGGKFQGIKYTSLRRADDFRYHASVQSRLPFIDENVRLMRALVTRLHHSKAGSEEIWLALQQAIKLASSWNADQLKLRIDLHVTLVRLREVSDLLLVCFRVGDALLLEEKRGNNNKPRLAWCRGMFQLVIGLRNDMEIRRSATDRMRSMFAWAVDQVLVLEFELLDHGDYEVLEEFKLKLERYDEMKHWKHDAAFQHLVGLVIRVMAPQDAEQLKLAQRKFAHALEMDKFYSPSIAMMAQVEVEIQKLHESMRGNIMSLSQRSAASSQQSYTAYMNSAPSYSSSSEEEEKGGGQRRQHLGIMDDSSSDEDDRAKRRRTLVGNRQSLAPNAAGVGMAALEVLRGLVKENPSFPPNLAAWDALVFHDDGDGSKNNHDDDDDDDTVLEEQRQSILRWVAIDGTLSGGAIAKLERLWALSRHDSSHDDVLARCFWAVADCMETLTQCECGTSHDGTASLRLWELQVCILNLLPEDTIVFTDQRKALWRSRFFALGSSSVGGPFQIALPKKRNNNNATQHDYLLALQAVVAHMCLIAPEFHYQVASKIGLEFVNHTCVDRACIACGVDCHVPF